MSTEAVDPRYETLERWPAEGIVAAMLEGQMAAIAALQTQIAGIASASAAAAERLKRGGRLVYVGAGTSGRLGVQDGVELRPTFGWPGERLVFLLAGGDRAITEAVEGAEDDGEAARRQIAEAGVTPDDVVIGIAASGRTPFTLAAIEAARGRGALTIAIANNPATPLLAAADHAILADTGSEVVAGSTRMKAGTAQKAALNLLSTATMVALGHVVRGRMVNMRVSNAKLLARATAMICELADVDATQAEAALDATGRDVRLATLVAAGASRAEADRLLALHGPDLVGALETWRAGVSAE